MLKSALSIATLLLASHGWAAPLTGTDGSGNPPVPGATATIGFEGQGDHAFGALTLDGVTFSGIGGDLRTSSQYAGQYNARGNYYLDNNGGSTTAIRFDFASLVSGFAFNVGASDEDWVLSAYDSAGQLIESVQAPVTQSSDSGDYLGLAAPGIQYAIFSTTASYDWIFIDNLTVAGRRAANVPEPGSLLLCGAALAGLGVARRRKSRAG